MKERRLQNHWELLRCNFYCNSCKYSYPLLLNHIRLEVWKVIKKNLNGFRRNRSTTSQIRTIRRIIEGVCATNLEATLLCVEFSKAFDYVHRGNWEQIHQAYMFSKETVTALMMLYKYTKAMVRSPDSDTDFFDIVVWVFQRDTLANISIHNLTRLSTMHV